MIHYKGLAGGVGFGILEIELESHRKSSQAPLKDSVPVDGDLGSVTHCFEPMIQSRARSRESLIQNHQRPRVGKFGKLADQSNVWFLTQRIDASE